MTGLACVLRGIVAASCGKRLAIDVLIGVLYLGIPVVDTPVVVTPSPSHRDRSVAGRHIGYGRRTRSWNYLPVEGKLVGVPVVVGHGHSRRPRIRSLIGSPRRARNHTRRRHAHPAWQTARAVAQRGVTTTGLRNRELLQTCTHQPLLVRHRNIGETRHLVLHRDGNLLKF